MTDTPETDNLARGNHVVPTEFAQQLERERDEARFDLDFRRELFKLQSNTLESVAKQRERLAELLSDIYNYAKGKKPHDYHNLLGSSDQIIAKHDAWQEIESKIEELLQTTPTQPEPE
jgi:hypothetical protein